MKLIETRNAAGQVLCHDLTQIIKGVTKDARFLKGHIVTPEDIPVLLSMGKEHLYVWEKDDTMLHEDEAAAVLLEISANSLKSREVTETSAGEAILSDNAGADEKNEPMPDNAGADEKNEPMPDDAVSGDRNEPLSEYTAGTDAQSEEITGEAASGYAMTELPSNLTPTPPREGKIELTADCDGLLKVDSQKLYKVNSLGQMMIACRHGNTPVKKGDRVAGMRVIPLVIEKEKMDEARSCCKGGRIFHVMPYKKKKYGIITTGGEVYAGRIKDTFTDTIREKLSEYGAQMIYHEICPDDHEVITASVGRALDRGAQMVFCTGGMSVDPDDKTPLAIKNTGAGVVTYGAPVLPGAMLMLAYTSEGVPIVGLPGCVMYAGRTVFDLILPRLMADDEIQAEELFRLGEGGLCLKCEICSYPNCGFGK